MSKDSFFIKTGHESIKFLIEKRLHSHLQHKGISKLLELDYKIIYRKWVENKVADTVSRQPNAVTTASFMSQSSITSKWMTSVSQSYEGMTSC